CAGGFWRIFCCQGWLRSNRFGCGLSGKERIRYCLDYGAVSASSLNALNTKYTTAMAISTIPTTNVGNEKSPVKKLIANDEPITRPPIISNSVMPTVAGFARRGFAKSFSLEPRRGSIPAIIVRAAALHNSGAVGEHDGLHPIPRPQFGEHFAHMGFHRGGRNEEFGGNFGVRQSGRHGF